jgi:NAD-dependent DNA ligase
VVVAKRPADSQPFNFEARLKELGLDAVRERNADPKKGLQVAYKLRTPSREMKVRRLQYFASKHCLEIDGLGEALAEKLVDLGHVKTPTDIFSISQETWRTLEKFGEKSVDNIIASIETSKTRELWRAINSLGLAQVGIENAKQIAEHFGSLQNLLLIEEEDLQVYERTGTVNKVRDTKIYMYCVPMLGKDTAPELLEQLKSEEVIHSIKTLQENGYDQTAPSDCEFHYLRGINNIETRKVYLKAKKAVGLTGTIVALGVPGIEIRTAIKVVSHSPDIFKSISDGAIFVSAATKATKQENGVREVFRKLQDEEILAVLRRAGAQFKATDKEFASCVVSVRDSNQKVLRLFNQPHLDGKSDEYYRREAIKFYTKCKETQAAINLWQESTGKDLYELQLDEVPIGAGLDFIIAAQKLSDEDREKKSARLSDATRIKRAARSNLGNVVVVSGKVEGMNREEAQAHVESLGYTVADSVTSKINFLVIGDDAGPSKIKKASAFRIPVINFKDLKPF